MVPDLEPIARVLYDQQVEFILIGGWAASLHGSMRSTVDIDFVYGRGKANIQRLVAALSPHNPYLRGAPPGLPFTFDERTVRMGLNFTLTTTLGDLDFLGEVAGGGSYEQLLPHSQTVSPYGFPIHVVKLEQLIQLKRAAGRPKDFEALTELQALLAERGTSTEGGS